MQSIHTYATTVTTHQTWHNLCMTWECRFCWMSTWPVVDLWWFVTSQHNHWHDRQDEITCMSSRDPLHVLVARFAWCSWVAIQILLTWHISMTLIEPILLLKPSCLSMKCTVSYQILNQVYFLNTRYTLAPVWGHYPLNLPWPSLTSSIVCGGGGGCPYGSQTTGPRSWQR